MVFAPSLQICFFVTPNIPAVPEGIRSVNLLLVDSKSGNINEFGKYYSHFHFINYQKTNHLLHRITVMSTIADGDSLKLGKLIRMKRSQADILPFSSANIYFPSSIFTPFTPCCVPTTQHYYIVFIKLIADWLKE